MICFKYLVKSNSEIRITCYEDGHETLSKSVFASKWDWLTKMKIRWAKHDIMRDIERLNEMIDDTTKEEKRMEKVMKKISKDIGMEEDK